MKYTTHFFSDHQRNLLERYLNELNLRLGEYYSRNKPLPAETFFKGFEIWLAKEHSKPEVKPSEELLLMVEFEKFCQKHKDLIKGSRQRLLDVISETCFPFGLKKENEIQLLNMSLKDARNILDNTSDAKLLRFHKFGSKSLTLLRMYFEETTSI